MNYPMKLMISGKSIAELAANARKFLEEIDGTKSEDSRQLTFEKLDPVPKIGLDYVEKSVDNVEIPAAFSQPPIFQPSVSAQIGTQAHAMATGELDSKGMPWDDRIHASSKAVTKDGSWRYKRGVEDSVIAQIEAQNRNQTSSVAAPPVPAVPGLSVVPPVQLQPLPVEASQPIQVVQPPPVQAPPVQAPIQAPVTPAPVMPSPQAPSLVHTFETFKKNLIPTLGELVRQGKLTQEYLGVLQSHFQVSELWKVNDEQLAQIFENFCQSGLLQKAL